MLQVAHLIIGHKKTDVANVPVASVDQTAQLEKWP